MGGYTVEFPELPGCITEGDTIAEVRKMARDAVALWLDADDAQEMMSHSGPLHRS